MTPERWRRIEALYHEARNITPGGRQAFLEGACRDDESLRREVERLLSEPVSDAFLEEPALHLASRMLLESPPPVLTGQSLGGYLLQGAARRGRHGRGLSRARREAGTRRRDQDPVAHVHQQPGSARALRAEARMLAALNHPNICAIYGVEEADGVRFLILELVEGETLAERLERRPSADGLPARRSDGDRPSDCRRRSRPRTRRASSTAI